MRRPDKLAAVYTARAWLPLLLVARAFAYAQDNADSPPQGLNYYHIVSKASDTAQAGDNATAVKLYKQALALNGDDGDVYTSLGRALFSLQEYKDAAAAYESARNYGFGDPAQNAYRIAGCFALAGDDDSALKWLEEALRSRYKERAAIASDENFSRFKNNPRFKKIIGALPEGITDRVAGWNYDLDFLAAEIRRLNPAFSKELPPDFRNRGDQLKRGLGSMTDRQVAIEVMALFASLHEAHTVMFPFGMQKGVFNGLIPLQLYNFSDGLFVIDAPEANRDLIGAQVLEIGGRDVSLLSQAIMPYVARDNDRFLRFAAPIAFLWVDLLKTLGAHTSDSSVEFTVRQAGSVAKVSVPVLPGPIDPDKIPFKLIAPKHAAAPPPDYLSHLDQNFWKKRLDQNTLYVQMNQMMDRQGQTLKQFADELDETIKSTKPKNVIVDVRLNNGGNYDLTLPLLKVLFGFEQSLVDARLFVIAGRNTLSAAQNFISTLDQFGGGIFVGEPSGSKPNHLGDDTVVTLPYSGISGSIACAFHQTGFRDTRQWIAPDIPVALSSHEYFNQTDPMVEAILAFIAGLTPVSR